MFTGNFISREMKYFHFSVWSISVCIIQPKIKFIVGVISLLSFWQKWNCILRDKVSSKHYPKQIHVKGNICASVYFIKTKLIGFYWMGRFFQTTPKTKFHFISPAMESYANRISFHCVKSVRIQSCSSPHFFRIFSHSELIRRDLPYLSVFSPNAGKFGKNADQNNSEYEHFLRRVYGGFKFHFGSHLNTLEIVL